MQAPPVALILFSHDLDRFLPSVERERKAIEEALEHFDVSNRLQVIARSAVSVEEIFRLFNRYQGRIALLHFAGHADGKGLQLNHNFADNTLGRAVGLAELLGMEVKNGRLQFVFLNGCSTQPQVEALKAVGVPSVIATRHAVIDAQALAFAQQFYERLANTHAEQPFVDLPPLQEAYQHALSYLRTSRAVEETRHQRELSWDVELTDADGGATWLLHSIQPDWRLSTEVADEQKPFNEHLTLHLIEAIEPHSGAAQKFLGKARDIEGWQEVSRITDKAKDILSYSFVGVLGIQLRKLFAIGKEPLSQQKQENYLRNSLFTAQRALQLLCFALLSWLWDQGKAQSLALSEAQRAPLRNFFDNQFGLDLAGYLSLLRELMAIFADLKLDLPMPELGELSDHLDDESDFVQAGERLHALQRQLDQNQYTLSDCFVAERQLTTLLKALHFLAAYRMISIKTIAYDEMRNAPPRYLHTFTVLGIDSKLNFNTERVNYVDAPTTTDAVLLFKSRYQQSINLFPFLIDLHALTFESGAKVCFYAGQDLNHASLNYQFLEDHSLETVPYQGIQQDTDNLNQLMMDPDKRKQYKLDMVWTQFQAAKQALLPEAVGLDELFDADADEFEF